MGQIRTKKGVSFIVIIILLFLLTYNKLHAFFVIDEIGHNGLYLLFLVLIILISGWNLVKTSSDKILLFYFLFCIPSLFIYFNGLVSFLSNASAALSPLCGFVMGKLLYSWLDGTNHKDGQLLLFLIPFFYSIEFILFDSSVSINEKRDATFLLCCYIPFVLLFKSNVKYLIIAIVGVLIVISAKRSSIIFIGIILLTLILGGITKTKHRIFKFVEICAALCIVSYLFIIWFDVDYVSMLSSFDRFEGMGEDGGSGRTDHYTLILLSFANSDFFSQLFGHGASAVSSAFGIPAHNDFLETLYDYGVLAAISLIVFWISIIVRYIKTVKKKLIHNNDVFLFIGVTLGYLTLIIMNCFITNPLYYILIFCYFGYFLTDYRQKEMQYEQQ